MIIKFILLIVRCLLFVLPLITLAQDFPQDSSTTSEPWKGKKPNQLKAYGLAAFKAGDYYTAVDFLQQYCRFMPENFKIALKLADAYRLSRDYLSAEEWYKKVYESDPEKYVYALFYLGQMEKANGKYDDASGTFTKFYKAIKGDDGAKDYKILVSNELKGCELAKLLMDSIPLNVNIAHLDTSINQAHVEMSPLPLGDTVLLYASLKADSSIYYDVDDDSVQRPVRKFYYAQKRAGNWKSSGEMPGPFNLADVNTGNGAYSPDGKRFYFSRCKKNQKDKMECSIYVSHLDSSGQWQEPVALDENINLKGTSSSQPTLGTESKKSRDVLYFVSNREEGGRGGMDVWYSIYNPERNTYSEPRNAGPKINSIGDEMTPWYHNSTHTLYYSSTGFPGLGGLDIFKSTGELTTWTPRENIGYPINSSADDLYYVQGSKKEDGFFVSNRKGTVALRNPTCCDDIFSFKYLDYMNIAVAGKVVEPSDSQPGATIQQAIVTLYLVDPGAKQPIFASSDTSDAEGNYLLQLNPGKDYKLVVSKEGYLSTPFTVTTRNVHSSDTLTRNLETPLIPKKEKPIRLENIYYDYNSAELNAGAKASIDTTLYMVMVENPTLVIELSSHTDSIGSDNYNLTLSQKRAESVVRYLIGKDIPKERLVAKGYGETRFVAPNSNPDRTDSPAGRQLNRRTEFAVIGKVEVKENEDDDN